MFAVTSWPILCCCYLKKQYLNGKETISSYPQRTRLNLLKHCAKSWLADVFKDKGAWTLEARDELPSEPTHTVYCANVVDFSYPIHTFIAFFPFWILNVCFIRAIQLSWKQSILAGNDGLRCRLAVVDAPVHMGYPKFRRIELIFIVGDEYWQFYALLFWQRLAWHVVLGLKYIPAQAGNVYSQMTREQLYFGIPAKCQDFSNWFLFVKIARFHRVFMGK